MAAKRKPEDLIKRILTVAAILAKGNLSLASESETETPKPELPEAHAKTQTDDFEVS